MDPFMFLVGYCAVVALIVTHGYAYFMGCLAGAKMLAEQQRKSKEETR